MQVNALKRFNQKAPETNKLNNHRYDIQKKMMIKLNVPAHL